MKATLPIMLGISIALAGCSAYRTDANVTTSEPAPVVSPSAGNIAIHEGVPTGRKYRTLGQVAVSVKKLTVFHADPTKAQANEALSAKAREIGADAVINVKYETGIGLMTWGYIDASGTAVRFE